jgi:cell division protein FtsB
MPVAMSLVSLLAWSHDHVAGDELMRTRPVVILAMVLVLLLLFLQYRLWFESGGIPDMWRLQEKLALQEKENEQLKADNDELLLHVQRLQNSQDAVESHARYELGMIKKDEKFYQVVR